MIRARMGAVVGMLACAVFAQAMQPERLVMVREGEKPAQKCRVLKCWRDKDGNKVCQVQAVDTGEMITILEPDGGTTVTTQTAKSVHWGGETKSPAAAPVAPSDALVVGTPKAVDKALAASRPRVSTETKITPAPGVLSAQIAKQGKPADWKESWGKVDRYSDDDAKKAGEDARKAADDAKKAAEDAVAKAKPPESPKGTEVAKQTEPKRSTLGPEAVIVDTPDVKDDKKSAKGDVSLFERVTGIPKSAIGEPTRQERLAKQAPPKFTGPSGTGAWQAATTTPPAQPARAAQASAANAFTVTVPGSGAMPQPQMMAMMFNDAGMPSGANNAFTAGGTSRPIPSDMARTYYVPNGLQGGGEMGGAESRPQFAMAQAPPLMPVQPMPRMPVPLMPSPPVVQVAATAPAVPPLQTLRDSIMPSEREMAVDELSRCDWRQHPEVLDALTKSAKADLAATVRAACVRALAKMQANTVPVVNVVRALQGDPDIRVRQEVEQALAVLTKP